MNHSQSGEHFDLLAIDTWHTSLLLLMQLAVFEFYGFGILLFPFQICLQLGTVWDAMGSSATRGCTLTYLTLRRGHCTG